MPNSWAADAVASQGSAFQNRKSRFVILRALPVMQCHLRRCRILTRPDWRSDSSTPAARSDHPFSL